MTDDRETLDTPAKCCVCGHPTPRGQVLDDPGLLLDAAEADATLLTPEPVALPAARDPVIVRDHADWRLTGVEQPGGETVGVVSGGRFGNVDRQPRSTGGRRPGEI